MRRIPVWFERCQPRLVRWLRRATAALVVSGLAVANPPALGAAPGRRAAGAASLISTRTDASVFAGSTVRGRAGVESSARSLVASLGGLRVAPGDWAGWVAAAGTTGPLDRCPPSDLVVSWVPPTGPHADGAYVTPLGPAPTDATRRVNGVVECRSSDFAFVGFEAAWNGTRWMLSAVPSLADETGDALLAGEAEASGATPAEVTPTPTGTGLPAAAEWAGTPIEPLATYVPQSTCDPTAKPGVLGFRDLLLATFPGTRNLGIGRVCEAEGLSEHKEGRAFDWGVNVDDPAERAEAEQVLAWMLGTDDAGEPYAVARRLGVMYVIWDGHIWSSFLADEGWRPYVGRSAHRDHIHVSFDWPGALATTSFWQGGHAGVTAGSARPDLPLAPVRPALPLGLPGLPALPPAPFPPAGVFGPEPAASSEPAASEPPPSTTTTTTAPPPSTTTTTAPPSTTTTTAPPPVVPLTSPTTLGLTSRL